METTSQLMILLYLAKHKPTYIRDLYKVLNLQVSQSWIKEQVTVLVWWKFLDPCWVNWVDNRLKHQQFYRITPAGKKRLNQLIRTMKRLYT